MFGRGPAPRTPTASRDRQGYTPGPQPPLLPPPDVLWQEAAVHIQKRALRPQRRQIALGAVRSTAAATPAPASAWQKHACLRCGRWRKPMCIKQPRAFQTPFLSARIEAIIRTGPFCFSLRSGTHQASVEADLRRVKRNETCSRRRAHHGVEEHKIWGGPGSLAVPAAARRMATPRTTP